MNNGEIENRIGESRCGFPPGIEMMFGNQDKCTENSYRVKQKFRSG